MCIQHLTRIEGNFTVRRGVDLEKKLVMDLRASCRNELTFTLIMSQIEAREGNFPTLPLPFSPSCLHLIWNIEGSNTQQTKAGETLKQNNLHIHSKR